MGQKYRNAMQEDDGIHFESMPEFSTHEQKDIVPIVEREYFSLYDELEEKCHPDRYLNPFNLERFALANELYSELQKRSRRDDNSLIDIREKAIDGLGIHISTRRLYEYLLKYCDPKIYTSMQPYDKARVQEAGRLFAKIQAAKDDIHELEEVWREAETFISSRDNEIDMKLAKEMNKRIEKQKEIDKKADKELVVGICIIIAGVILLLIFG